MRSSHVKILILLSIYILVSTLNMDTFSGIALIIKLVEATIILFAFYLISIEGNLKILYLFVFALVTNIVIYRYLDYFPLDLDVINMFFVLLFIYYLFKILKKYKA